MLDCGELNDECEAARLSVGDDVSDPLMLPLLLLKAGEVARSKTNKTNNIMLTRTKRTK